MIIFLALVLGVIISIVLPLIKPLLPRGEARTLSMGENRTKKIFKILKPYLLTGLFSILASIILLAMFGDTIDTWQKALLAGYTADSTLQKLNFSAPGTPQPVHAGR